MSNSLNNLTKAERSLINKRANVLAQIPYIAYRMRLIEWAEQRKQATGQMITAKDLNQVVPDISADLK